VTVEELELHPDLVPYVVVWHGETVLDHPMVRRIPLWHVESVNAEYVRKKAQADQAITHGNYGNYIFLHERPHRLSALLHCIGLGLSGAALYEAGRDVWMDSESVHQNRWQWRRVWHGLVDSSEASDEQGKATLTSLPVSRSSGAAPLSLGPAMVCPGPWIGTRAAFFATRFTDTGFVAAGLVEPSKIRACFIGRDESEVVVFPEDIRDMVARRHVKPPERGDGSGTVGEIFAQ
jgi:hypothetical protein